MVSFVVLQYWGPGLEFDQEYGVRMFSLCSCGFLLGSPKNILIGICLFMKLALMCV